LSVSPQINFKKYIIMLQEMYLYSGDRKELPAGKIPEGETGRQDALFQAISRGIEAFVITRRETPCHILTAGCRKRTGMYRNSPIN
jgi:hypothetical protein